jgi:hypothetical protein
MAPRDRHLDVQALPTGRLRVRLEAECGQRVAELERDRGHLRERQVDGVEVEEDVVGPVRPVDPRRPDVEVDRAVVDGPEQRTPVLDDHVAHELPAARLGGLRRDRHPRRRLGWRVLDPAERASRPVVMLLDRQRTVAQVRQQDRCDRVVVGDDVALVDPVLRPPELVGVRHLHGVVVPAAARL